MTGLGALCTRGDRSGHLERWYRENGMPTATMIPKESIPDISFRDVIRDLLGDAIESSPTDIEKYVSCPFKFFAVNALRANPRREYQISSPDVGSILHGLLTELVGKYINDENPDEGQYLETAAEALAKMKYNKIFTRDTRHAFLRKRLLQRAVDSFMILRNQVGKGEFKPIELEAAFGRNRAISAPVFSSEGHSIYLNGRIDRVDGAIIGDNEYFRIIDYKSSDRKLSLYKINEGLDIQLASYLMAYGMHSGTEPAGMYYFTTDKKIVGIDYGDEMETVYNNIISEGRMEGYTLNDAGVIKAMDCEAAEDSDVIPVKYNKKKEEFTNKVLQPETIKAIIGRVGEIITENTDRIYECDFPVEPVSADKPACTFCEFNDICGFDPRTPGSNFRYVKSVRDKDVVWSNNE
jgi:ATP-dependent helicase/nuclease subunit B